MEIVTYLLGAGASANCLPVVKGLSKRIRDLSIFLKGLDGDNKFSVSQIFADIYDGLGTQRETVRDICNDLEWVASACDRHSSIDTFAKKLFILKSPEYQRLKIILSVFFTLEQKLNLPDLRYDNFWASIINVRDAFPPNLRIVSWNYDFQLEQSYLNFSDNLTLAESYSKLSIRSFCDPKRETDPNGFSVYKLNGSATITEKDNKPTYFSDDLNDDKKFYEVLLRRHELLKKNPAYECNLTFAWEHNLKDNYFQELKQSLWDTKVLVIIGYSFPYFNSKIDSYLVNDCMPSLEKVYFQAPDAINLKERFSVISEGGKQIRENKLLLKTDLDQFTFPNEL